MEHLGLKSCLKAWQYTGNHGGHTRQCIYGQAFKN
jgi:hypothetical protein